MFSIKEDSYVLGAISASVPRAKTQTKTYYENMLMFSQDEKQSFNISPPAEQCFPLASSPLYDRDLSDG